MGPVCTCRTNTIGAVARIRNALAFATHDFFQKHGFLYVHTPLITASDCEGAGEMFQVGPQTNILGLSCICTRYAVTSLASARPRGI